MNVAAPAEQAREIARRIDAGKAAAENDHTVLSAGVRLQDSGRRFGIETGLAIHGHHSDSLRKDYPAFTPAKRSSSSRSYRIRRHNGPVRARRATSLCGRR